MPKRKKVSTKETKIRFATTSKRPGKYVIPMSRVEIRKSPALFVINSMGELSTKAMMRTLRNASVTEKKIDEIKREFNISE